MLFLLHVATQSIILTALRRAAGCRCLDVGCRMEFRALSFDGARKLSVAAQSPRAASQWRQMYRRRPHIDALSNTIDREQRLKILSEQCQNRIRPQTSFRTRSWPLPRTIATFDSVKNCCSKSFHVTRIHGGGVHSCMLH